MRRSCFEFIEFAIKISEQLSRGSLSIAILSILLILQERESNDLRNRIRLANRMKKIEMHIGSRDEWRSWLEEHYGTVDVVWLTFYKNRPDIPTISYDDAVEEALCFGWIDSTVRRIDDERYVRKFTPRREKSRWSAPNKKRAERMIREGLMTEAGMEKIRVARRNGMWEAGASMPQSPSMPPEFREALKGNPAAEKHFAALAPSYRREYLGWIGSAKREETRLKRIAESIALLEKNEKLGMK